VEEYYLYDPQTLELTGWLRVEEQLEALAKTAGIPRANGDSLWLVWDGPEGSLTKFVYTEK